MLTSIRGLSAATFYAGILFSGAPAFASDDDVVTLEASAAEGADTAYSGETLIGPIDRATAPVDQADLSALQADGEADSSLSFSANVTLATEYRFRGVALTDGNMATQGGFDFSHDSGLYVGTWASNLDEDTVGYGSAELDIYGGWSGDLTDGFGINVGAIAYVYPDAGPGEFDYYEVYGSTTFGLGPASLTAGVAYAFEQESLGGTDNFYVYSDLGVGIPGTPLTATGHIGYTDGFLTFTEDSNAIDWSVGVEAAFGPLTASVAYVGVEGDPLIDPNGTFTDDAVVASITASF